MVWGVRQTWLSLVKETQSGIPTMHPKPLSFDSGRGSF